MITTSANAGPYPVPLGVLNRTPFPGSGVVTLGKRARKRAKRTESAIVSLQSLTEEWSNVEVRPGVWKLTAPGIDGKEGVWRQANGNATFFPSDGSAPFPKFPDAGKNRAGAGEDDPLGLGSVPADPAEFEQWSSTPAAKRLLAKLEQTAKKIEVSSSAPAGSGAAVKRMMKGIESGKADAFLTGQKELSAIVGR